MVTGDSGGKIEAEKIAPNLGEIEGFKKNLTPETIQFLKDKRGLTGDSLKKYQVGWCTKKGRNTRFQTGMGQTLSRLPRLLLYDSDQEGREGVKKLVLPAFRPAVEAGQVLGIKVVWLYDKIDKAHKDMEI